MKKRKGVLLDVEGEGRGEHQICSLCGPTTSGSYPTQKEHLEPMLKDLIEEAAKVDLEPKPASLRCTSTYASEEKEGMILGTSTACYKFPFEDEIKILFFLNRQGKTCDAVEEKMQPANKAFWKDIKIHKSKDVSWRRKCQRLVDHVFAVFSFGSETWSWTRQTVEKIERWETKIMTKSFLLERQKEGTWVEYETRTSTMARKIWVQMKLPFLFLKKKIAESVWRAMGWACNEKWNAVIFSL